MTKRSSSPAVRTFQFLGRVQFTMLLLLGGAAVMIVGTVLESRAGTAAAQASVYRTGWFDAYLVLIAVNLVVSVINRLPIQRHQWAFVLTHVSVALLLVGAWVSRSFGYEGQLAILEGTEEHHIVTDDTELRAEWSGLTPQTVALGRFEDPTGRTLPAPTAGLPEVRVEQYVPHGVLETTLADAGGSDDGGSIGGPGVEVHLDGMGLHTTECLVGENRTLRRKDLGPVELELLIARSPEFLAQRLPERQGTPTAVQIRLDEGLEPVSLELPGALDRDVELAPGLHARVLRYLRRARVEAGGLTESPTAPVNPAAIVEIRGDDRTETHTVFGEFPQFNLIKGREEDRPLVAEVRLQAATTSDKPLVSLLTDPAGKQLYVQLSAGTDRGPAHPFELGDTVAVGSLGLDLRVLKFLPGARVEDGVRAVDDQDAEAWLGLSAEHDGQAVTAWLRFGASQTLLLGEHEVRVSWGRRRVELPFAVALEDFEIEYHPGSRRPAQYQSRVRIRGADGVIQPAVISMNRPLDHGGFRLFQSSYRLRADGRRDVTFLTVSRDPGVPLVYGSFILLVIGVGWYLFGQGHRRTAATLPDATDSPTTASTPAAARPDASAHVAS